MKRRDFLKRSAQAAVAIAAAPVLAALPAAPAPLAFHPLSFCFVMEPITLEAFRSYYIAPAVAAWWDEHDRQLAEMGVPFEWTGVVESC